MHLPAEDGARLRPQVPGLSYLDGKPTFSVGSACIAAKQSRDLPSYESLVYARGWRNVG